MYNQALLTKRMAIHFWMDDSHRRVILRKITEGNDNQIIRNGILPMNYAVHIPRPPPMMWINIRICRDPSKAASVAFPRDHQTPKSFRRLTTPTQTTRRASQNDMSAEMKYATLIHNPPTWNPTNIQRLCTHSALREVGREMEWICQKMSWANKITQTYAQVLYGFGICTAHSREPVAEVEVGRDWCPVSSVRLGTIHLKRKYNPKRDGNVRYLAIMQGKVWIKSAKSPSLRRSITFVRQKFRGET